jgi:hypothetical protein
VAELTTRRRQHERRLFRAYPSVVRDGQARRESRALVARVDDLEAELAELRELVAELVAVNR